MLVASTTNWGLIFSKLAFYIFELTQYITKGINIYLLYTCNEDVMKLYEAVDRCYAAVYIETRKSVKLNEPQRIIQLFSSSTCDILQVH